MFGDQPLETVEAARAKPPHFRSLKSWRILRDVYVAETDIRRGRIAP